MSNIPDSQSVTEWLDMLKEGRQDAAQYLWNRYNQRLIRLANDKLHTSSRWMADEEDVAVMAFSAFLQIVETGRFDRLENRDDLWALFKDLTEKRAIDELRAEGAIKRGRGKVKGDSGFQQNIAGDFVGPDHVDCQPTPAFAAEVKDQFRVLLEKLDDGQLQQIAIYKMEGYTNAEIADQIGRCISTVERKLGDIREIWRKTGD